MDTITSIDVCNAALARLGEAKIQALNQDNAASRACALNFPLARDEILRSHRWNFATARAQLPISTTPVPFGWAHAFGLPVDCLRVLEVNGVSATGSPGEEWEIENGMLLLDSAIAQIVYITRVEKMMLFDSLALEALIVLLASKLAPAIQGGSTSKAAEFLEEYHRVLGPIARRVDGNESRRDSDNVMEQMMTGSRALQARSSGG